MKNFLKKLFHKHKWNVIDQTMVNHEMCRCVLECEECGRRKSYLASTTK